MDSRAERVACDELNELRPFVRNVLVAVALVVVVGDATTAGAVAVVTMIGFGLETIPFLSIISTCAADDLIVDSAIALIGADVVAVGPITNVVFVCKF